MKQIKVFVHPHRAADLLHALGEAGFHRVSLFDVKGLLLIFLRSAVRVFRAALTALRARD